MINSDIREWVHQKRRVQILVPTSNHSINTKIVLKNSDMRCYTVIQPTWCFALLEKLMQEVQVFCAWTQTSVLKYAKHKRITFLNTVQLSGLWAYRNLGPSKMLMARTNHFKSWIIIIKVVVTLGIIWSPLYRALRLKILFVDEEFKYLSSFSWEGDSKMSVVASCKKFGTPNLFHSGPVFEKSFSS